ncbi:MAG: molecular chaperone HtpG, partial [Planktomarina sp.]|nr:molecular chaperone HtpG [Planktomarina sp.]
SQSDMNQPVGTCVKLFLKKDAKEYCEGSRIRNLVKKYSDHIQIPIKISEKEGEVEQVNSAQALWTQSPTKISKEEYKEFYNSSFGAFDDPFITIHNKSEGTVEFTNLLFVPTNAPFDLHEPERKSKINLYINRVFITNDLQEIVPSWLRFLKGILDTSSLDLNVSREMVQSSPILKKISKSLTKRVLSELKKKQKKDPDAYDAFWSQFGKVIKEGLYEDFENRDKIAEIIRVYSNKDEKLISLQDYIDNFADGQNQIFYFTGDTLAQAKSSPHLEGFKAKGIDVLLMVDPIDAFWISQMNIFQEKSFVSISRDKYDIDTVGTSKTKRKKSKPKNSDVCIALIKDCLEDKVENAIASTTLIDSPVRLVAGEGGLDFNLERILKAQNPEFETSKKVLEVNVGHDLIQKLPELSLDLQKALCRVLFEQARIQDGEMPSSTQQFSQDIIQLGLEL